jgi:hypothetical protein
MVANVAFLAALTTFLAVAWLAGELSFLAPFKAGIFRNHGVTIGRITVLPESVRRVRHARWLFLRDAGRKLAHMGQQPSRRRAERPPQGLHTVGEPCHVAGHRPS